MNNVELKRWIRSIHKKSLFTCSICTGALLLGSTGLLKDKQATTHWNHFERLRNFGAIPVKSRYIIDGKIITAAGISAGIDMSLKLAGLIKNDSTAQIIQLAIEYDPMPPYDAGSPEKIPFHLLDIFKKLSIEK